MGNVGQRVALLLVVALSQNSPAGGQTVPGRKTESKAPSRAKGVKARPALPPEAARRLKDLEEEIESARRRGLEGEDRSSQDEALREGIRLAGEAVTIREKHQGQGGTKGKKARAEWHELADARWALRMFQTVLAMKEEDRTRMAKGGRLQGEGEQLLEKGLFREAEPVLREALEIDRRLFPGDHPRTAASLSRLARADHLAAGSLLRQSLDMYRRIFPGDHPSVATSLNNLALYLREQGDFEGAKSPCREALEMKRRLIPEGSLDLALNLESLASILKNSGDLHGAEPLLREAIEMRRRLFPGDDPDVASTLDDLSALLRDRGDLAGAELPCREALEMRRRLFPGDHLRVATGLNNIGLCLNARGDLAGAERAYREALEMLRRLFPGDHPSLATSLSNLAALLRDRGDLEEAGRLQREALEMDRRLFKGDHPSVAASLNNLAQILRAGGDLQGAEDLTREVLEMARRVFPDDHQHVGTILNNLGALLMERGDLEGAERFSREALEMRRRLFPGDHMDVAMSLGNLGILLKDRGDLEGAEPLCREALGMSHRLFPADHPQVATALSNLAWLLGNRGDAHGAEELQREALEMFRRLFPGDHPSVALAYHNLAYLLYEKGDLQGAEEIYRKALEMSRRLFPGDHPDPAASLDQLGGLLRSRRDLEGAGRLYSEALDMRRRLYPGDHPDLVNSLGNVANVLLERGDISGAEAHSRDALEMSRRLFPGDHPQVAQSLTTSALLLQARGDLEGAESAYGAALSMAERLRPRVVGDEQARAAFAGELEIPGIALGHAAALAALGRPAEALGACERGRGRALLDLLERGSLDLVALGRSRASEDPGTLVRLEEALEREARTRIDLTTAEARAQTLQNERIGAGRLEGLAERKRRLAALEEEAEPRLAKVKELRRKLSEAGAAVLVELRGLLPDTRPLPVEEILRALPRGDIILSYLASSNGMILVAASPGSSSAMVLGRGPADFKKLGDLARTVRAWIAERPPASPDAPGETAARELLGALLPAKAMDLARKARRLVVLPDGPLGEVPLDLLLALSGDPELEAKAVVHAASATVYVNRLRANERGSAKGLAALLVAQPIYEREPGPAGTSRGDARLAAETSATDQVRLFGGKLKALPGTRREALAISEVVRRAKGDVKLLLAEDATVGALSLHAPGKRFVHIATHGLMGSAERPYDASLALTRPREPGPEDIGFLRLEEILRGWRGKLEGCDLVVLSACNTERGIRSGESVLALPWGFFYAGARSVVASLWEVDDQATALLMVRFYENLLGVFEEPRRVGEEERAPGKAFGVEAALREAKAWLRNLDAASARMARTRIAELSRTQGPAKRTEGKAKGSKNGGAGKPGASPRSRLEEGAHPYAHPYFWAAFVCVGKGD